MQCQWCIVTVCTFTQLKDVVRRFWNQLLIVYTVTFYFLTLLYRAERGWMTTWSTATWAYSAKGLCQPVMWKLMHSLPTFFRVFFVAVIGASAVGPLLVFPGPFHFNVLISIYSQFLLPNFTHTANYYNLTFSQSFPLLDFYGKYKMWIGYAGWICFHFGCF